MNESFVRWFYKIQEPRWQRILYFVFYCTMVYAGVTAFAGNDDNALGAPLIAITQALAYIFGGVLGAIAIIPGAWYLERVGLVSIGLALTYRTTLEVSLGISTTGAAILCGTILLLIIRFVQIRRADLAPIRG